MMTTLEAMTLAFAIAAKPSDKPTPRTPIKGLMDLTQLGRTNLSETRRTLVARPDHELPPAMAVSIEKATGLPAELFCQEFDWDYCASRTPMRETTDEALLDRVTPAVFWQFATNIADARGNDAAVYRRACAMMNAVYLHHGQEVDSTDLARLAGLFTCAQALTGA